MRVLVTGGAGYIGSQTCKALARAGHEPVTLDNLSVGHEWAVRWGPLIVGDVGDAECVGRAIREHRIDAVLHFAGSDDVGESMRAPHRYYDNNLRRGLGLLDAVVAQGVSTFVFSSSCSVYGVQRSALCDESHPTEPVSVYGETKLAFERALHWHAARHGFRHLSLRYFNAAGADPERELGETHEPEPHVLPRLLRVASGALDSFEVSGVDYPTVDGSPARDFVHVADLADAHVAALERLARGPLDATALNLGTGTAHTVRELCEVVREVTGKPVRERVGPRRPGDPPLVAADGSRARALLGWAPTRTALHEIVETAWAWERQGRAPAR